MTSLFCSHITLWRWMGLVNTYLKVFQLKPIRKAVKSNMAAKNDSTLLPPLICGKYFHILFPSQTCPVRWDPGYAGGSPALFCKLLAAHFLQSWCCYLHHYVFNLLFSLQKAAQLCHGRYGQMEGAPNTHRGMYVLDICPAVSVSVNQQFLTLQLWTGFSTLVIV